MDPVTVNDWPSALSIANIAALITVAGVGVNLIARIARTEMKVDLMWADFRTRMPGSRHDDPKPP